MLQDCHLHGDSTFQQTESDDDEENKKVRKLFRLIFRGVGWGLEEDATMASVLPLFSPYFGAEGGREVDSGVLE